MAHKIDTIRKRSVFLHVRDNGISKKSNGFNLQLLEDSNLDNIILIGYIASKKIGKAVMRNKAKRIMRELARNVISKYGKLNTYYILIAKSSIFDIPFKNQKEDLQKLIS